MIKTPLAAAAALPRSFATAAPATATPPPPPTAYDQDSAWLCLPGRSEDPCAAPLPTAALNANGYGSVGRSSPAANPPADCLYVYPTVSRDPALNSDPSADREERSAAHVQFARFHELCRTYAPIYRQLTLASLAPGVAPAEIGIAFETHDSPPAAGARFGRAMGAGMTVACTDPAALAGGWAPLDSYWCAPSESAGQITWSTQGAAPTPFLRTEGLATGECVNDGPVGYLSIRVAADPRDQRTDEIPGDVVIGGRRIAAWGMHLGDMPLAMGDLMRLVEAQIAAFLAAQGGERG